MAVSFVPARVLLLGDSITQQSFREGGWGARLADHFQRRADVVNRGFSGYNSEWINLILPQILPSTDRPPDVVTVFLGANDSALAVNTQQHVPLERYKKNIAEICNYLTKTIRVPSKSVLVISPPPLCDSLYETSCREGGLLVNRKNAVTLQYAQAAMEAGTELGVTTVNLFSSMSELPLLENYFSDGLHLSSEGDKFFTKLLIPLVEERLKDFPKLFPNWDDVNAQNPHETFCSAAEHHLCDHA